MAAVSHNAGWYLIANFDLRPWRTEPLNRTSWPGRLLESSAYSASARPDE